MFCFSRTCLAWPLQHIYMFGFMWWATLAMLLFHFLAAVPFPTGASPPHPSHVDFTLSPGPHESSGTPSSAGVEISAEGVQASVHELHRLQARKFLETHGATLQRLSQSGGLDAVNRYLTEHHMEGLLQATTVEELTDTEEKRQAYRRMGRCRALKRLKNRGLSAEDAERVLEAAGVPRSTECDPGPTPVPATLAVPEVPGSPLSYASHTATPDAALLASPEVVRAEAAAQLVSLSGGRFRMGCDNASEALFRDLDGEAPERLVDLAPFRIARFAASARQFAAFVNTTGHVTEAERYGWSFVFANLLTPETFAREHTRAFWAPFWVPVSGASWWHPEGPDTHARGHFPATQLSHRDAAAFCQWWVPGGKGRLPSEAEWEYAARGGLPGNRYPWGMQAEPGGVKKMNIWESKLPPERLPAMNFLLNGEYYVHPDGRMQLPTDPNPGPDLDPSSRSHPDRHSHQNYLPGQPGDPLPAMPAQYLPPRGRKVELTGELRAVGSMHAAHQFYSAGNTEADGHTGPAPVDAYGPQNAFGLYNVVGNTWEWVADWWAPVHNVTVSSDGPPFATSPMGPATGDDWDGEGPARVLKGGWFGCHWLTCPRMRPSARKHLPPNAGSNALGVRCAADL